MGLCDLLRSIAAKCRVLNRFFAVLLNELAKCVRVCLRPNCTAAQTRIALRGEVSAGYHVQCEKASALGFENHSRKVMTSG